MTDQKTRRFFGILTACILLITVLAFSGTAFLSHASTAEDAMQQAIDKLKHLSDTFTQSIQTEEQDAAEPETAASEPTKQAASGPVVVKNETTGYAAVIVDNADLLDEEEEEKLLDSLEMVSGFCNAIFFSNTEEYAGSEIQFGGRRMEQICAEQGLDDYTAVLLMIDMYKRKIAICPSKNVYPVITDAISNTITDNVYTYASREDYGKTANEAFLQMFRVLDGQKIAQPMRYITAALLAVFAGLAVSLILVRSKTKRREAGFDQLTDALEIHEFEPVVNATLVSTRKVRHTSSGGGGGGFSGGGGGGFSGGGGGGGGFSGGGGSHSF